MAASVLDKYKDLIDEMEKKIALKIAADNNPTDEQVKAKEYYDIGRKFYVEGKLVRAEEQFILGIKIDQNNYQCHKILADHYRKQGRLEEAEVEIREEIRLCYYKSPSMYENLMTVLEKLGKNKDEVSMLRIIAIEAHFSSSVGHKDVLGQVGLVLFKEEKYADAIEIFKEAIKREDKNSYHNVLIKIYSILGDKEAEANQYFLMSFMVEKMEQKISFLRRSIKLTSVIPRDKIFYETVLANIGTKLLK